MSYFFRAISSLFLSILFIGSVSAQDGRMIKRNAQFSEDQPLVVVDSFTTDITHLLLSPDKIESIDVLKDSKATAKYGEMGKYGVIVIKPKKNIEIVKLDQLLNQFSIPETDRSLNVSINNVLVKDVNKLVADKNDIASIQVVKDNVWITPQVYGPEERHINIVTKNAKQPW